MTFNIRDFAHKLNPSHKGGNFYQCPVCGGNSLHINSSTGAYKCFSGDCASSDIRSAIAPPLEPKSTPKASAKASAKIAEMPPREPAEKRLNAKNTYETKYLYSQTQFVVRYEYEKNGKREKYFKPHHIDSNGTEIAKKGDQPWPLYGISNIIKYAKNKWINESEGEKCADHIASLGLVACSATGTANDADIRYGYKQAMDAGIKGILYHQDNDETGERKAKKHQKIANELGINFIIIPAKELDPDIKEKGDIADLIIDNKITKEGLVAFLEKKIKESLDNAEDQPQLTLAVDNTKPSDEPLQTFNQIAVNLLFKKEGYKAINGQLAKWKTTHYELMTDADELKRIADFCNSYPVVMEQKDIKPKITYPYAKPKIWKEVLECAKTRLHIGSVNFQTTGINCKNGVLSIKWEDKKPIINFEKHDPEKHYFLSEPMVDYNPLADSKYCDQLLMCLDKDQRQILLRNLAASLDILTVRKYHGRKIKLLLCIGGGSNGKDSIREVVSVIFGGKGMTSFSLDDFIDYDRGIKNSLAGLELSRINWASESNKTTRLDNSKSLKSFATGDTLIARYLHKDGIPFIPQAIGLFNLNEIPNLYGTSQAAMDRFAPITFEKTFVNLEKYDPTNKNHMIADPRFKYDPQFIAKEVAPAFLNYMIQGLKDLMEFGIDYTSTEDKLDQIQKDNNHLFEFAQSIGLETNENSTLSISELYSKLEQFYIDEGILTLDGGIKKWLDPSKPSDKYVKGSRLLFEALRNIFPNIRKVEIRLSGATKPTAFIKGLTINFKKIILGDLTPNLPPNIPQVNPKYTPNENAGNPYGTSLSPSSYTPNTPNTPNYLEKNISFDDSLDGNSPGDSSKENKKYSEDFGVFGVRENPETLDAQELQPENLGYNLGLNSQDLGLTLGLNSQDLGYTTPDAEDILEKLGEFKVGDRIKLDSSKFPDIALDKPIYGVVEGVELGFEADDKWLQLAVMFEYKNKHGQQYLYKELGRGDYLAGNFIKV